MVCSWCVCVVVCRAGVSARCPGCVRVCVHVQSLVLCVCVSRSGQGRLSQGALAAAHLLEFVRQLEEVVCVVIDLHAWRPRRLGELVAHGDVERVILQIVRNDRHGG
jgi:hypothetical protein